MELKNELDRRAVARVSSGTARELLLLLLLASKLVRRKIASKSRYRCAVACAAVVEAAGAYAYVARRGARLEVRVTKDACDRGLASDIAVPD